MTNSYLEKYDAVLFSNYRPMDIVIEKGAGSYVWDLEGTKYLDFTSGYGVNCLGHANIDLIEALSQQAQKVLHVGNHLKNTPSIDLAELLVDSSFNGRVYLCNSGSEANEAAIKFARSCAARTKSKDSYEIIVFSGGFHGRTMGALSATANPRLHEGFRPLVPGFRVGSFNDVPEVTSIISDRTCAVLVEPVQGEGGVHQAQGQFLRSLRALTRKVDALLIFDEVQCGVGRTGKLFAYQHFDVEPDVITLAKGLGGGFPIGAMIAKEEFAFGFPAGSHGCTFGGNPLASAVAKKAFQTVATSTFLSNVVASGEWLKKALLELEADYDTIAHVRGFGLMIGFDLKGSATNQAARIRRVAAKNGLLILSAGQNTIRLLPPPQHR